MSDIQSKITSHATKQENMTIMRKNIAWNTSRTGTDTLADEDIKRVIIVVFYVLKN